MQVNYPRAWFRGFLSHQARKQIGPIPQLQSPHWTDK